jgi:hypothetical protein
MVVTRSHTVVTRGHMVVTRGHMVVTRGHMVVTWGGYLARDALDLPLLLVMSLDG